VNEKLKFFVGGMSFLRVAQMLWARFYGWWLMRKINKELAGRADFDPSDAPPEVKIP
jgi:hypothetical protein